jgi:hypothetical protein
VDFGTLKSTVATYLNRSDLTSYIPGFVAQAERRISYGSDAPFPSVPVRIPAMQARATGTFGSAISFPSRFLDVIRLKGTNGTSTWALDYASPSVFTELEANEDPPVCYAFLNNTIETAGSGSGSYTLDYYQAFAALSVDADTNWLLTNASDAYLFAALLESAPFIADLQMVTGWHGMYKSAVSALNRSTMKPGGGSMQVRAR